MERHGMKVVVGMGSVIMALGDIDKIY